MPNRRTYEQKRNRQMLDGREWSAEEAARAPVDDIVLTPAVDDSTRVEHHFGDYEIDPRLNPDALVVAEPETASADAPAASGAEGQMRALIDERPSGVETAVLAEGLRGGQPLSPAAREAVGIASESKFDDVRIHTGAEASALAHDLGAKAFTVGHDIAFAEGEYAPDTADGRELLAHEMTHAAQQRSVTDLGMGERLEIGPAGDSFEQEADRSAQALTSAAGPLSDLGVSETGEVAVQRTPEPLPSGAPIFQLVIDSDKVMNALKALNYSSQWPGAVDFDSHPVTEDIRKVCGGNYFRGNNYWSSGWVDDDWSDWYDLGLADVDIKVDLALKIDNKKQSGGGTGTFSSGGSTTDTAKRSESTTVSGGGKGTVGGHEGAPGGEVSGGVSHTSATEHSMEVKGESGLSMSMGASVIAADVIIEITYSQNATLTTTKTYKTSVVAGTIVMGAPAPAATKK